MEACKQAVRAAVAAATRSTPIPVTLIRTLEGDYQFSVKSAYPPETKSEVLLSETNSFIETLRGTLTNNNAVNKIDRLGHTVCIHMNDQELLSMVRCNLSRILTGRLFRKQ